MIFSDAKRPTKPGYKWMHCSWLPRPTPVYVYPGEGSLFVLDYGPVNLLTGKVKWGDDIDYPTVEAQ